MQNKKILIFSEDAQTLSRIKESLGPVHNKSAYSAQVQDAFFKLQNETFDVVIMRTNKASLKDPKGLFSWCQGQKNYRQTPFIIVGEDIEDKNILVTHEHVRFLPKDWKASQLFDILDGLFFEESDAAKKMVNAKFVNPIVGAVVDVLKTMAQIDLARGAPSLIDKNSPRTRGDVTGMISVNSENFSGSLAIVFKESLAIAMYKNMTTETKSAIDDDVKDSVMEITNIVFGNARRDLNLLGHSIKTARPSIVVGKNHEVTHSSQGLCLHLPFSSPQGSLVVELLISIVGNTKKIS